MARYGERNPLPAKECRCGPGRIYNGDGGCAKCGHDILPRCPATGILVPECHCRRCVRGQLARYAPHLLP